MHDNRIKELRRAAGMSQDEIGALLGVDRSVASRYESGKTPITDERKLTLARHFGVTVSWLMGWPDAPGGDGDNDGVKVAA